MVGKVPLIDVKQLHSILMNELKSIDSSSTVRASLLQEIQVSNIYFNLLVFNNLNVYYILGVVSVCCKN